MQVFQIKGIKGFLLLFVALVGLSALLFMVPSALMMVFWNALVFEGLRGPEINFLHGLLLWVACLLVLKLVLNPQVNFQFRQITDPADLEKLNDLSKRHHDEE